MSDINLDDLGNTPAEHGGVTDDDIAAFFASNPGIRPINPLNGANPALPVQFHSGDGRVMPPTTDDDLTLDIEAATAAVAPPEPAADDSTTAPQAEGDGVGDGTTEPPPAPEPAQFVTIGDQQVPVAQIQSLLDLQRTITEDAALRDLISGHFVGRVAPVEGGAPTTAPVAGTPAAAGVTPPEGLDMDDPSIAGLWQMIQAQSAQIAQLSQGVQTTYQAHMANERQNAEATYRRAAHDFKTAHELSDEDIKKLSDVAARLNVVPSLLRGVDPLTGVPVKPDALNAVNRALEIAYFMDPTFRDREFQRSVKAQQTDAKRKKNLGAVGGSAGSVARTTAPPRPGTPEAKQAMLAEVGQMMTGEWSGDN